MSTTRAQRKKRQKSKAKERRKKKTANIERHMVAARWRLDVLYGGSWRAGVREFRRWPAVEGHIRETEKLRRQGTEIAAGRVIDLREGKIVMEIAPSPSKVKGKGALPDKFEGEPEAAKKGILGFMKKK